MTTTEPAPLRILDEGKHHVVVFKPSNTVVVKGRGAPRPTVLDMVQAQVAEGARPVHRLDRGTSGCCIFAKTPFGQQALSEAFRRHVVDKRYVAVVRHLPSFNKLAIDARLLRIDAPDQKRGPMAWQTIDDAGQRALTRIRVLARHEEADVALIEARLETGRMHQIRAHLAHVGHPIVDDTLYDTSDVPIERRQTPHAFALHAFALSAPHGQGDRTFALARPDAAFGKWWPGDLEADMASAIAQFEKSAEAHATKAAAATQVRSEQKAQREREQPKPKGDAKHTKKSAVVKKAKAEKAKAEKAKATPKEPEKKMRLTDDASKQFGNKRGRTRRGGRHETSRR